MRQALKFLLLVVMTPLLFALPFVIDAHRDKARLMKEVWDHAESIREACDTLRSNVVASSRQRIVAVDPESPHVPKILRDLHPTGIEVREGRVQIGLSRRFGRCGLMAFPSNIESAGARQIVSRLWWYED